MTALSAWNSIVVPGKVQYLHSARQGVLAQGKAPVHQGDGFLRTQAGMYLAEERKVLICRGSGGLSVSLTNTFLSDLFVVSLLHPASH